MQIVVSARSFGDVASAIEVADVIELRLDLFNILPKPEEILIQKPTIVTIRRKREGGGYEGSEEKRLELIKSYSKFADFVDIENDARDEFFDVECRVIESYHNFEETPSYELLRDMVEARRGEVFKIATLGKSKSDVLTITKLLCEYDDLVAFLMGEKFAYTRIISVFLGSPFIYCHVGKAVAAGQIEAWKTRKILEMLGRLQ
jgi:3-dehydroquinate dehydratase-1